MKVIGIYIAIAIAAFSFFSQALSNEDFTLKIYKEVEADTGIPATADAFNHGGYNYISSK